MHISNREILPIAVLCLCVVCAPALPAADSVPAEKTVAVSVNAQPYTFPYRDAMYGTLAGFLNVKNVSVSGERVIHLNVPQFSRSVPVHAVIQPGTAPLAVVLLGIGGQANTDFSRQ